MVCIMYWYNYSVFHSNKLYMSTYIIITTVNIVLNNMSLMSSAGEVNMNIIMRKTMFTELLIKMTLMKRTTFLTALFMMVTLMKRTPMFRVLLINMIKITIEIVHFNRMIQ